MKKIHIKVFSALQKGPEKNMHINDEQYFIRQMKLDIQSNTRNGQLSGVITLLEGMLSNYLNNIFLI